VLGKRPGAVRTAAYRGLRRLAESLDDAAELTVKRPSRRRCDTSGRLDADVAR
jgi:RNA polymerase sigma-70 factor (ECF subfamily)